MQDIIYVSEETMAKLRNSPAGIFIDKMDRAPSGKWSIPVSQGVFERLKVQQGYGESMDALIQRLTSPKR